MVSVWGGQRIGIDIGGHGERNGKISYSLVTRSFVDHNWEVGFFFFPQSAVQVTGGIWAVTFFFVFFF